MITKGRYNVLPSSMVGVGVAEGLMAVALAVTFAVGVAERCHHR